MSDVADDANEAKRNDAWKPLGWDDWSPKRRTLWRREQQAERMARLEVSSEAQRAEVALLIEHLRREAEDLRRQVAAEDDDQTRG